MSASFFVACERRFVGSVAFLVNTGALEELQVFTLLSLFWSLWMWRGQEENLPHQKCIFCMTLSIMSKALKHMIMPWHAGSTCPVCDVNVGFKYRCWAFPFVFIWFGFDLRMVKKGFTNISVCSDMQLL